MPGCKLPLAVSSLLLCAALIWSQSPSRVASGFLADNAALSPVVQTVLYSITASDLKGELSFISSDALQGRYTPSPGLDVAAEFIASQFRAAGLEPGGDQDYFQTAAMVDRHMPKPQSDMTVTAGPRTLTIAASSVSVVDANQPAKIDRAPVLVFASRDPDLLKGADLTGKAVVVSIPVSSRMPHEPSISIARKTRAFDKAIAGSGAAVEILVGPQKQTPTGDRLLTQSEVQEHRIPVVAVSSDELQPWMEQPDASGATVSLDIPAPEDHRVVLKNVVGILRGSDPNLKDTCVLLTAHYDHLGTTDTAGRAAVSHPAASSNDHIYNGANDDGSGTVSVTEIAKALAKLNPHPRRSIVFVTFFGEERGELGSQYYARHPVFPLSKTVADLNLEQLGRTDATGGRQVNSASVTGFDYSDVSRYLDEAGRETGIHVYLDKEGNDAYFARSDNASFAEDGVPAHSITVAFDFPDYHGLGDRWQKIDYENMARVDRMIALAVVNVANAQRAPEWNAQNPKTVPYREAQQRLRQHGGAAGT